MNSGIKMIDLCSEYLFLGTLILLSVLLIFCLIRACLGPTVADRLIAINMMGTIIMVMIGILALLMKEGYLVDISLIYAMLSFLAVIVLSKVIIGIHKEDTQKFSDLTTDEDELVETEAKEQI